MKKEILPHMSPGWMYGRVGRSKLLQHPKYPIWNGALSPDAHWILFAVTTPRREEPQWFIAPLQDRASDSESTWIPINGEQVQWSPDEGLLYLMSDRDGFPCIYSQRLDTKTKRPIGTLQPVRHFHSARRSVIEDPAWRGTSIARDKIVITLVELTENIWMSELPGQ